MGQTLTYTIILSNTGNVTLTNILVTDPLTGLSRSVSSLAPGASNTITENYTITQDDLNRGYVDNTATASCNFGGSTLSDRASIRVTGSQNPRLTISKSARETNFTSAGDIINYTFTVSNTGNVTLTGVTVSDPNAVVNCPGAPATLSPNASITCSAVHTVTGADVGAGSVRNIATVTGYGPGLNPVTASSNEVTVSLNNLPPGIACPGSIITNTSSATCDILIGSGLAASYSDPNNNVESLTWTMSGATVISSPATGINNLSNGTFNLGVTTVTYTVTDAFGLSATCSFTVTVNDNTIPNAVCKNISVNLDLNNGTTNITATDINDGSSDNCGIATMTIDITEFDCRDIGPNDVTLTVTDNSGNIGRCTAVVTVNYAANPTVTPSTDVVCDGETTRISLNSDIPSTSWTWSVNASPEISGAVADNSGVLSSISQVLLNSDNEAHNVTYTIIPRVYGLCELPPITSEVWVNPEPK